MSAARDTSMTPERSALAALARVFALGATDDALPWITAVPGLEGIADWSEDQRLAEHERVLGRGVFAYESVFTREDALRSDELVAAWYRERGFAPEQPDQLGVELAYAAETGDAAFIEAHLARWVVPALIAIERQGSSLYGPLAAMTRELLHPTLKDVYITLPPVDDPLDNDRTGLRRLSEFLLVPVKTGWFLSRDDILRLAAAADSPCGFGSRVQMLEAYFRTAVENERLAEAVGVLLDELTVWESAYTEEAPTWAIRAAHTRAVLERLAAAKALPKDGA